jgi:hypothetical protein
MASPAYLAMEDEEFLKQMSPEAPAEDTTSHETQADTAQSASTQEAGGDASEDASVGSDQKDSKTDATTDDGEPSGKEGEADNSASTGAASPSTDQAAENTGKTAVAPAKDVAADTKNGEPKQAGGQDTAKSQAKTGESAAPDYEGFYKRIMTPFKANGKMVELRTPEEAVQLMQMGANYTRKMQDLVPHRKALLMLENNGLLDEGKLSYLIDLDKKNPEAIKKLVKEAGIDPMEIDTTSEPAYRAGNHRVTDEEAAFRVALDDMKSNQPGLDTLQVINTDWDQASKELLWKSPEVMAIIQQQRESGIYDRITTEMNRQKTLGQITPTTPFLQAYKAIGDQLVAQNAFADLVPKPGSSTAATPAVVATTVRAPKAAVANNEKARAASSTRTSAQTQTDSINPLAMSDDEFLKRMKNRI